MRKMMLMSLAALASLGIAAPASAQYYDRGYGAADSIAERIDRNVGRGELSGRVADGLLRELDLAADWERLAHSDGRLTRFEERTIDRRYASIEARANQAIRSYGGDRRDRRYARRYR